MDETRVLESVAAPGRTIKYIDQVVSEAPADIRFVYFSWRAALFGRYDVFHVHWPEFLLRGRSAPITIARSALFRALLLRLRIRGTPVVRTMHNLHPHEEGGASEKRLLKALDRLTSVWVRISTATEFPETGQHFTVLHGSYERELGALRRAERVPGRLLFIGRIEPYKGVEELARCFKALTRSDLQLRIVGRADSDLEASIRATVGSDERVTCLFEFVPDETLVAEVTAAELVVLPYREMHNSGIALVALSLGVPILASRSPANEALAREVGDGWVSLFDGEITGAAMENAVASTKLLLGGRPRLQNRSWESVAEGYAVAFRAARERGTAN